MGTARLPYTLYVFSASPPSPAASGATRRKDEGAGIWATQQDSNLRPSASHADALISAELWVGRESVVSNQKPVVSDLG